MNNPDDMIRPQWLAKAIRMEQKLTQLEDAMSCLPKETWFNFQGNAEEFVCLMQLPRQNNLRRKGRYVTGTGDTYIDAFLDAVENIKEASRE